MSLMYFKIQVKSSKVSFTTLSKVLVNKDIIKIQNVKTKKLLN